MNINDITINPCKKCGCTKGYLRHGEVHTGLHCSTCNSWIKWVSKAEIELLNNGDFIIVDDVDTSNEIDIEALKNNVMN